MPEETNNYKIAKENSNHQSLGYWGHEEIITDLGIKNEQTKDKNY